MLKNWDGQEVSILGADQKNRGLWGRQGVIHLKVGHSQFNRQSDNEDSGDEIGYFRTSNGIFTGSLVSKPLVKRNEDPEDKRVQFLMLRAHAYSTPNHAPIRVTSMHHAPYYTW